MPRYNKLTKRVKRIEGDKTDREVAAAASENCDYERQLKILSLFGSVEFDPIYDYKAERNKKRNLV